ncbi:response regulator [Haloprofundus salinisoli]|uniref:response regulator n=1 Tax=Haloprofundus salinisoli TaxID=2876193 RepID=UPI001CCC18E4|nr:response regulator [Haloprofundus salinisoli]
MGRSGLPPGEDIIILLVEDNQGDVRLLEEAFHDASIANTLYIVNDGDEALDFVKQRNEYADVARPDLILLDWKLPTLSGEEVLKEIKSNSSLEQIPVIVLTGSEAQTDIITSYNNQANAYVPKPVDPDEFIDVIRTLENFWLSVVRFPTHTDED